jgi:hypothetical protein
MLEECSRSLSGTFGRQEILSWFRRHYPNVPESTVSAHIQAFTSNATNRDLNHPGFAGRTPFFERVSHGEYRLFQGDVADTPGTPSPRVPTSTAIAPITVAARDEWHWEGQVQARVVTYLAAQGVSILRVADTASREHGTDIEGVHAGVRMHVEVKGWPSSQYVDPARAGEQKRTPPALQARVWFADGLMQVLRLRTSFPAHTVALALPAMGTYRRLFDAVRPPVVSSHVSVLWVTEDGGVELDGWGAPERLAREGGS